MVVYLLLIGHSKLILNLCGFPLYLLHPSHFCQRQ
uniref:Uncharacterized protein n=1 Tax=Cryptococcus bacillisporus CA1280 TaxID=1296109 RepID=A0A0D0VMT8_CRYGA|nr:hypothetical protein I312_01670 [Cryptococcus bacillisporus CA1280]